MQHTINDTRPYADVMVDLETLGTTPGSIVLSIGLCPFDALTAELGSGYYTVLSAKNSREVGLTSDDATLGWWDRQTLEARGVLDQARASEAPLQASLSGVNAYLATLGDAKQLRVWGNGSDFDQPILAAVYRAVGMTTPWRFYNNRCYRTLKNLLADVPLQARSGTYHNAFDDAQTQAIHAIALLRRLDQDRQLAAGPYG